MIHPKLLKAARLLLEISQDDLATTAGISRRTLVRLETLSPDASFRSVGAVQRALESHGVIFIEDGEALGFKLARSHFSTPAD
jgi:predicted transcriptional regulator